MAKSNIVVCDAGPLIHLDEMGCLELLFDFDEVLVPDEVWQEVNNNRKQALDHPELKKTHINNKTFDVQINIMIKAFSLDKGESDALTLFKEYPYAIFLTDDSAARFAATQLGIKVHGTIGIIIRAIRQNIYSPKKVISILREIPDKSTLYIRKGLLDKIIEQIKSKFGE